MPPEERECMAFLVDVAETLTEWNERLCLIGGWAVYVLTEVFQTGQVYPALRHRGSRDVDLSLSFPLIGETEANRVAVRLESAGYQCQESFRWIRGMPSGQKYDLDLMMVPPAEHADGTVQIGRLQFAPFWYGDAALQDTSRVILRITEADGAHREAQARVAGAAGLLYAKAQVVACAHDQPRRVRQKHFYDIFALTRTYPGGADGLAERLRRSLSVQELYDLETMLQVGFGPGGDGPVMAAEILSSGRAAFADYVPAVEAAMAPLLDLLGKK